MIELNTSVCSGYKTFIRGMPSVDHYLKTLWKQGDMWGEDGTGMVEEGT